MKHENALFIGNRIEVDGNQYISCTFENCVIVYGGGDMPFISSCRFVNVTLSFENNAALTLVFLSTLYNTGFKELIENTFNDIRHNRLTTPQAAH